MVRVRRSFYQSRCKYEYFCMAALDCRGDGYCGGQSSMQNKVECVGCHAFLLRVARDQIKKIFLKTDYVSFKENPVYA